MQDINFFQEYLNSRHKRRQTVIMRSLAISVALGLSAGSVMGTSILARRLEHDRLELEKAVNNPENIEGARITEEKRAELMLLKAYESWLAGLDSKIRANYTQPGILLDYIFNKAPEGVHINEVGLEENHITLEGTASSQETLAQYKSSLGRIPLNVNVTIRQMISQDQGYRFTIVLSVS